MNGEYDDDKNICTVPAGDKAISVPWGFHGDFSTELLVLDQLSWRKDVKKICSGIGLDPEYVSPIAAVESYTSRGQLCSQE